MSDKEKTSKKYRFFSPITVFLLLSGFIVLIGYLGLYKGGNKGYLDNTFMACLGMVTMLLAAAYCEIYTILESKRAKEFFATDLDIVFVAGATNTYIQVGEYFNVGIYRILDFYIGYAENELVVYSRLYGMIGRRFSIPYADIDSIEYISEMWARNGNGMLPGVRFELNGKSCSFCAARSYALNKNSFSDKCYRHKIEFCLVRGGTYFRRRMSQEKSYKRFEEFRDKVMEMKRLTGEG